jgi:hypothetical protein
LRKVRAPSSASSDASIGVATLAAALTTVQLCIRSPRDRLGGPESYVKRPSDPSLPYGRQREKDCRFLVAREAGCRRRESVFPASVQAPGRLPHKITLEAIRHRAVRVSVSGASKARSGPHNTSTIDRAESPIDQTPPWSDAWLQAISESHNDDCRPGAPLAAGLRSAAIIRLPH